MCNTQFHLYEVQNQAKLTGRLPWERVLVTRGASGIQVVFCFLPWGLVRQVCSFYENSLGSTLQIYMFLYVYTTLQSEV